MKDQQSETIGLMFFSGNYRHMATRYGNITLSVPRGFPELLGDLSREILREQPKNIPRFAAAFFQRLVEKRGDNFVLPQAEEIVRQPPPAPSSPSITTPNATDPVKIEAQNTEPEVDADFQESIKGEDAAKAATLIQSRFRGYQVRKSTKDSPDTADEAATENEVSTKPSATQEAPENVTEEKQVETVASDEPATDAAAKEDEKQEDSAKDAEPAVEPVSSEAVEEQAAAAETIAAVETSENEKVEATTVETVTDEATLTASDETATKSAAEEPAAEETPAVSQETTTESVVEETPSAVEDAAEKQADTEEAEPKSEAVTEQAEEAATTDQTTDETTVPAQEEATTGQASDQTTEQAEAATPGEATHATTEQAEEKAETTEDAPAAEKSDP